jgi:hypothetical protein
MTAFGSRGGLMTYYWNDLNEWGRRMAKTNDGIVYDNVLDRNWDWGQALCRELYGTDWQTHPEFLAADEALYPPKEAIERALAWENGEWPDWVEIPERRPSWTRS